MAITVSTVRSSGRSLEGEIHSRQSGLWLETRAFLISEFD
jgi:hypothetical protein